MNGIQDRRPAYDKLTNKPTPAISKRVIENIDDPFSLRRSLLHARYYFNARLEVGTAHRLKMGSDASFGEG